MDHSRRGGNVSTLVRGAEELVAVTPVAGHGLVEEGERERAAAVEGSSAEQI